MVTSGLKRCGACLSISSCTIATLASTVPMGLRTVSEVESSNRTSSSVNKKEANKKYSGKYSGKYLKFKPMIIKIATKYCILCPKFHLSNFFCKFYNFNQEANNALVFSLVYLYLLNGILIGWANLIKCLRPITK